MLQRCNLVALNPLASGLVALTVLTNGYTDLTESAVMPCCINCVTFANTVVVTIYTILPYIVTPVNWDCRSSTILVRVPVAIAKVISIATHP